MLPARPEVPFSVPAGDAIEPAPASVDTLAEVRAQVEQLTGLQWIGLLRADQHRRWQQGDRVTVESYLEQVPDLRGNAEAVLDLIGNEMVLAARAATSSSVSRSR